MKTRCCILLFFGLLLFFAIPSFAGEEQKKESKGTQSDTKDTGSNQFQLSEIEVRERQEQSFVEHKKSEPATQDIITRKTIDLLAGPAQINPYKTIDLLPSVHSESSDAFGSISDQNNIRIRGQYGDTFTRLSRTIEGLPISANVGSGFFGTPINLEDVSEISLIRGAVPVDRGFGFGNAAGALDQYIQQSSPKFGMDFRQSAGSNNFTRTYFRVNSGNLPTKTNFFFSGSYMEADKWRGEGNGMRRNVSGGFVQELPSDIKVTFFGSLNTLKQHAYRPLTYAQATDSTYLRHYDYNRFLTGNALTDTMYYNYNRQEFDEDLAMMTIEFKPSNNTYFTFKPYYYKADGYRMAGSGATTAAAVINRNNVMQEQYGILSEFGIKLGPTLAKLGYWYQSMDTMPPSTDQKDYYLVGGSLKFKQWSYISKVGKRTFHEPYLMLNNTFDKFRMDTGIKYVQVGLPSVTGYKTSGVPDVSYDDVFNYTTVMPGMDVRSSSFKEWLPYFGAHYEFTKEASARFTYGRNYASPWAGPVYSTYYSNYSKFNAAGLTLQDLWDDMKLEISDNFDLGFRYNQGSWYVAPTLFYSRFKNKQVPIYDSRVGTSYYQSRAEAESKGIELEAGFTPISGLTIFGSASYNKSIFTDNIRSAANTIIQCKNNQLNDSPEYLFKLGVTYTYHGFSVTPILRYVSQRYGDVQNEEKVDAYTLVDLNLSYTLKKIWSLEEVMFGLSFSNLFNEKYISIIKNDQDATQTLSTTYYPGAPFTAIASVRIKY